MDLLNTKIWYVGWIRFSADETLHGQIINITRCILGFNTFDTARYAYYTLSQDILGV